MTPLPIIAALVATATTTAKPPPPKALKVLIPPTISGEQTSREPELENRLLASFSDVFTDAAIDIFAWRHFFVIARDEAELAIQSIARGGVCRTVLCTRDVAYGISATHALFSRLTKLKDGTCVAVISLYDLLKSKETFREKREIKPCLADNVLSAAMDLGKRAAEGPQAAVNVSLNLTPKEIHSIDIADIDDVSLWATTTSTVPRKRRGFTLERALEIYKEKYMFIFEDDAQPDGLYVARNNRLITECEMRRAASAPLPRDVREFCDGNNWEFAWIGFPVGGVIAYLSSGSLDEGGGVLGFLLGLGISGTSAALAIMMNIDAVDVEEGVHFSDREAIQEIVKKSNETLREVLDLTPAEVKVAGMRE